MSGLIPAGEGVVAGWGGLGVPGSEIGGEDFRKASLKADIGRGWGRAYGDAACPPPGGVAAVSLDANRILGFDETNGVLRAEAGMDLLSLKRLLLPRGWFVPVTPGTQFVTLGGAVASDVHGKNHHVAGTFGQHLTSVELMVANGDVLHISPEHHPDLFWATVGGQGLTGHIQAVSVRMERVPSPWIMGESRRVADIDELLAGLRDAAAKWPMTVSWLDALSTGKNLGRGILTCGRWATAEEAPRKLPKDGLQLAVPFRFPGWILNDLTMKAFNFAYYWKHFQEKKEGIMHPDPFFYPLDAIHSWNRIYGRRGFTQHQCVIPDEAGMDAKRRYIELLAKLGGTSFLCVIKDCGPQGQGMLSFPMQGMSVALDIPLRKDTQEIVDQLNRYVLDHGGRIYLAKDTFTRAADYRAMDPRVDDFLAVRHKWDPDLRFRSALSMRLFGDPPPR